jgi:hypothetical protein
MTAEQERGPSLTPSVSQIYLVNTPTIFDVPLAIEKSCLRICQLSWQLQEMGGHTLSSKSFVTYAP